MTESTEHVHDDRSRERAAKTSVSRLFAALADARRRRVLGVLAETPPPVAVETLAEVVAAREAGGQVTDGVDIERVLVSLYHVHLPKLADAGLVTYDPDRGVVEGAAEIGEDLPAEFFEER